ncbi:MAG: D-tyrosyl-tRNA(Tyr) deacylase [Bacillati bacterium ANGP1]|uniref:D-aminoacyl-tRNA deacylase n=1 Tax=Candidatus Segetimicrobium genomatis TaxID=2569760 RepID=A0A537LKU5_9BACT|nr:MAG: D-tyrosyl-tRNA(Tyr) deacylase [Terrabacteria group bacterium ANGP1]TMJ09305.1 MAG: D-tyrosyl-tRNA(Tyr) deacylase [Terrabacteria group bacterium ANGP1]
MRAVVQRVVRAAVKVDGAEIAHIEHGYAVLVGVSTDDTDADAKTLAEKIAHLRIFDDEQGKLNRSILDVRGAVLSVSQFTLYGDTSGGRRPSFVKAAPPQQAEALYEMFNQHLRSLGVPVETGQFRAVMVVDIQNHGPVTIILDTRA